MSLGDFRPEVAADALEWVFHPDQTIKDQPDGSLIVRFRAGGALEISWHLYTWGDAVEVLEPTNFRMRFQRPERDPRADQTRVPCDWCGNDTETSD